MTAQRPRRWRRACLVLCLTLCAAHWLAAATAAEKTPFWIGIRSNIVIDEQVAEELGRRAGLVALRAAREGPGTGYSFPDIVSRIKNQAPAVPVLAVAWVSRYRAPGRIESYLLEGLNLGTPLGETRREKGPQTVFLDVTVPGVRRAIVERLAAQRAQLGVDGYAVDLATRTPAARPRQLAVICDRSPVFCDAYAKSMDGIMGDLKAALGMKGTLLYNGLWNFAPGMLQDQARLLRQADSAAIEYFGMNPGEGMHKFEADVLPYLKVIPQLPANKPVAVFGRGSWGYKDYAADYYWQRYLYAAFLLGRRKGDLFKYHSSFQVPAHAGRAGGLDVYADWNIDIGDPLGPFYVRDGVYQREFRNGRVLLVPDDGTGRAVHLDRKYHSPEGKSLAGQVFVAPGESLILLNSQTFAPAYAEGRSFAAGEMAAWRWAQAGLQTTAQGKQLRLNALPGAMEGEHDLLLDYERSLRPYERLKIDAVLTIESSAVLAVAEVDDPEGRHNWAVVAIEASASAPENVRLRPAVHFRAPARQLDSERWPQLRVKYGPDRGKPIVLDGPEVFSSTKYRFRRWSHVRLIGPMDIEAVSLSRRSALRN